MQQVAGRYRLFGDDEVGFDVGAYDPRHPLVVDPVLTFSGFVGGSREDFSQDVAVFGSSVYLVELTLSPDFPSHGGPNPSRAAFSSSCSSVSSRSAAE